MMGVSRDRRDADGINLRRNRPLSALLLSVFVVMIGYGVALTVLPVYTERIHGLGGASNRLVAFHLGVLTSVFALAQLVTGPSVGRLGDRIGRRPLILAGLAGVGVTEAAFAFTSSLWWLYALRVAGGMAASLLTVGALAAIADQTSEENRAQGMAWFGTAVSLGVVAGPLLGGLLGRAGTFRIAGLRFDGYTLPFLAAGMLALSAGAAAFAFVPESLDPCASRGDPGSVLWHTLSSSPLLGLVTASQFGLALFEGTFVLYARERLAFGPGRTTAVFVVCGLVMAVLQTAVVGPLTRFVGPARQAAVGFVLMGGGIGALMVVRSFPVVLTAVGVLALGTALVIPNLSSLVATTSGGRFATALGMKSSAGSLGQFLGPLVGGSMLAWRAWSPYALAAFTLLVLGGLTARAGPSLYDGVVAGDDGEEPPQKRRRIRRRGAG